VPDDLAEETMVEYYRGVKKGLGASAALSAAQRVALAKDGPLANAVVCGSFVAIGDGSSAPRLSHGPARSRIVLLALVVIAAALVARIVLGRRR
jgi:hypothetical protein